MLKILMCVWSVVLKTIWNFLLTSSVLEKGLLLSELSGTQFQDIVFQCRDCSVESCIRLISGTYCALQG